MTPGWSWQHQLDRLWFSPRGRSTRGALRSAAGLISPSWCVGCGAEDTDLCEECAYDIRLLTREPFRAEKTALALPIVDAAHAEDGLQVLPVIAAASYGTLLSRTVLSFKDHERIQLARTLAPALGRAVEAALEQLCRPGEEDAGSAEKLPLLIAPPVSLSSRTKRSHHPLGHLLGRLSRSPQLRGAEVAHGLLAQRPQAAVRAVLPGGGKQKGRTLDDRRKKLAGSFRITPRGEQMLPGRQVLLVDDVLTTGATIHELYRVLTEAGAKVRGACVLAVAEVPRGGDSLRSSGLE